MRLDLACVKFVCGLCLELSIAYVDDESLIPMAEVYAPKLLRLLNEVMPLQVIINQANKRPNHWTPKCVEKR